MIIIFHFFVQPQNAVVQRAVSLTANLAADEKKTVSLSRALKLLPGQKSAEERESLASRLLLGKIGAVSYNATAAMNDISSMTKRSTRIGWSFDQEWISGSEY